MAARLKLSLWIVLTVAAMSWLISCVARGEDGEPQLLYFPVATTDPTKRPVQKRTVKRIKILFFTAKWCPHCPAEVIRLEEYLATSPVPWELDESEFAHCQIVDADKRPDLIQRYRVTGLPTIMLVDDGKEVARTKVVRNYSGQVVEKIEMVDVFREYGKRTAKQPAKAVPEKTAGRGE